MNMVRLVEIENRIRQFPIAEQLWLVERVAQHIREQLAAESSLEAQLAAMAADPNIQRELREIEKEFDVAMSDGLELQ
ncbi:hypothetical protein [Methylomagnum ishizawai]|uniref:hypothetical protein n=1 Tax=Methylomagnum ishizawai TaxID=1760988 RepID=UPI001C32DD43|nr:hypothetical protein [Methylomagnum ishizawai]BBL76071.1 hypothetical protein MishRS11D_31690 [Methylomagnum ishizawai]